MVTILSNSPIAGGLPATDGRAGAEPFAPVEPMPQRTQSADPSFGARLLSTGVAWSLAFAGIVVLLGSLGAAAR